MAKSNVFNDGSVHVCAVQCHTCIFHPDNLMNLEPGRVEEMIEATQLNPAGSITCHKTLDQDQQAICRGWYDRYSSPFVQIAYRLHLMKFVYPSKTTTELHGPTVTRPPGWNGPNVFWKADGFRI